ncbi:MAG: hypothetical protein ACFCD0_15780 [Gemmataceae bacterium]
MSLFHYLPRSVVEEIPGWEEALAALSELVPSKQATLILQSVHFGPDNLVVAQERLDHFSKESWDAILDYFQRRAELVQELSFLSPSNKDETISNRKGRMPNRPPTPTEKALRVRKMLTDSLGQWGAYSKQAEELIDRVNGASPIPAPDVSPMDGLDFKGKLLQRQARRILPAADQLAREASALVEHAALDDLDRTELRVLLANFEVLLFPLRMLAELREHQLAS